jgi:hypothetical protein
MFAVSLDSGHAARTRVVKLLRRFRSSARWARLRCGSACHRISRAPAACPTALRTQAQGVYCLEAAAELLIAQP